MEPTVRGTIELFLWGIFGGCAAQALLLFKARANFLGIGFWNFVRMIATNFGYLVPIFLMIMVGGIVVVAYHLSGFQLSPIIAIHLGASAPVFVGNFAATAPEPARVD